MYLGRRRRQLAVALPAPRTATAPGSPVVWPVRLACRAGVASGQPRCPVHRSPRRFHARLPRPAWPRDSHGARFTGRPAWISPAAGRRGGRVPGPPVASPVSTHLRPAAHGGQPRGVDSGARTGRAVACGRVDGQSRRRGPNGGPGAIPGRARMARRSLRHPRLCARRPRGLLRIGGAAPCGG